MVPLLEIQSQISDRPKFVLLGHRSAHKSLTVDGDRAVCTVMKENSSTYEGACWHVVRGKISQIPRTH